MPPARLMLLLMLRLKKHRKRNSAFLGALSRQLLQARKRPFVTTIVIDCASSSHDSG